MSCNLSVISSRSESGLGLRHITSSWVFIPCLLLHLPNWLVVIIFLQSLWCLRQYFQMTSTCWHKMNTPAPCPWQIVAGDGQGQSGSIPHGIPHKKRIVPILYLTNLSSICEIKIISISCVLCHSIRVTVRFVTTLQLYNLYFGHLIHTFATVVLTFSAILTVTYINSQLFPGRIGRDHGFSLTTILTLLTFITFFRYTLRLDLAFFRKSWREFGEITFAEVFLFELFHSRLDVLDSSIFFHPSLHVQTYTNTFLNSTYIQT